MSLRPAEEYLKRHYDFSFNELSLQIEVTNKKTKQTEILDEDILFIELIRKGLKTPIGTLISLIKTISKENTKDPLKDYFKAIKKIKTDLKPLEDLTEAIEFKNKEDKEFFKLQFIKWMARAYKTATSEAEHNKQCLVFTGPQNIGKTGLARFLCPKELTPYYAENFPAGDKDAKILLAQNFLINLDELSSLQRKEITELKAIFSKAYVKERLPYDRRTTQIPRRCSFLGTTNELEILEDTTGNVRWIVFYIKKINWKKINKIDINKLWKIALDIAENKEAEMTAEELKENEERNKEFRKTTYEEDLIIRFTEEGEEQFMTTSEVLEELSLITQQKLNINTLGRVLRNSHAIRKMCSKTKTYRYSFNWSNEYNKKRGFNTYSADFFKIKSNE